MIVLVLNCGSSSLKYQLFNVNYERVLAKGYVEKIGLKGSVMAHFAHGEKFETKTKIPNHSVAIKMVLDTLSHDVIGVIGSMEHIDVVGHRIVHGGSTFKKSVLIDEDVIDEIDRLSEVAPLHNPPAVLGIRACQENIPGVPMVAVFDTSFHQTMPPSSYLYALDYELYEKYGIRRYGFHGTSHRFVSEKALAILGKPVEETKIITCHLGNGASIAAIEGGKCIDTTMGYTPLEGLVMGTRCGDIDPAIVPYLSKHLNMSPEEIDNYLNKKSGILGISGISSDLRDVASAARKGNERAELAIEVMYKRIVHYIGAYIAEMNGVDAIVFTAGMGENSIELRQYVCEHLSYAGVDFNEEANNVRGQFAEITKPYSKVKVYVIPTNEELLIAKDASKIVSELEN